ncbi:hypothetical protein NC796_02595 [Aliifodinibius sp. S!AR15-10]|uniref:hypothetical protein n=1 Tax=Aliifodinibius sp. S!AR15-10 TaxID=2950437 RepID=UPI002866434A|nr:hypothetical protein [Aliifodinibius sp. S!AR15-10]MDR8390011.1 hypothetical protein [Aliifodinibius sp. S!AR15-10]
MKSKTSEKGRGIVKSGIASLTISGLLSTGRLSTFGIESTLLILLSILEMVGYLYGMVAISSGATQTYPVNDLLKERGKDYQISKLRC